MLGVTLAQRDCEAIRRQLGGALLVACLDVPVACPSGSDKHTLLCACLKNLISASAQFVPKLGVKRAV